MSTQLQIALERIADRGEWRGADGLFDAAMAEARGEGSVTVSRTTGRRLPGYAVAVAAAALVIVVVGAVALWASTLRLDDESVSTDTPAVTSTTVVPETTTVPPTTEAAAVSTTTTTIAVERLIDWRDASVELPQDSTINAVAASGDALIAVGERVVGVATTEEYPADAAAWISTDGKVWNAIDDPSFAGVAGAGGSDPSPQRMSDVAIGPLGILAVGADSGSGAVWISSDGLAWREIRHDQWDDYPNGLHAVAAGGPGWVAIGNPGDRVGDRIWVSPDGESWQQVVDDDLEAAGDHEGAVFWDIAATDEGLVVVGEWYTVEASDAAIWVSRDGLDWERVEDAFEGSYFEAVSFDPTSGTTIAFSDAGWAASDGAVWRSGTGAAPPPTAHVAFMGGVWVAAGRDRASSVWVSPDQGSSWVKELPNSTEYDQGNWTVDTIVWANEVIIVGSEPGVLAKAMWGDAAGSTARIWIGS